MKKNMGRIDRMIRFALAVTIAGLYFTSIISGTVALILILLMGVFLLTGLFGFCPLYFPFKISTRKKMGQ